MVELFINKYKKYFMEVRPHTHSERKRFKHYLWEFLMLFLAVFCGFLAENFREHKVEKEREKQYIVSMVEDLDEDILNIDSAVFFSQIKNKHFDTVLNLFHTLSNGYNPVLRNNLLKIMGFWNLTPTDKTMQQLKNSGGMRLIKNKRASDGITLYDLTLKDYATNVNIVGIALNTLSITASEVLDYESYDYDSKTMSLEQIEKGSKNYLLKNDKASLGKYYNQIKTYMYLLDIIYNQMGKIKLDAEGLKILLKKEYHLK